MKPAKIRPQAAFVAVVAVILIYGAIYAAGAGYARGGGQFNAFSPSNTVEIEADSIGDVTTIAGNRNTVQRPYTPESEQHQRGEWLGLLLWALLFAGVVYYLYIRANDYHLLWSKTK